MNECRHTRLGRETESAQTKKLEEGKSTRPKNRGCQPNIPPTNIRSDQRLLREFAGYASLLFPQFLPSDSAFARMTTLCQRALLQTSRSFSASGIARTEQVSKGLSGWLSGAALLCSRCCRLALVAYGVSPERRVLSDSSTSVMDAYQCHSSWRTDSANELTAIRFDWRRCSGDAYVCLTSHSSYLCV